MGKELRGSFSRAVAIVLMLACVASVPANAAMPGTIEPMASTYLNSYNALINPICSGTVHIEFSVTGDNCMDDIGALNVTVYESTDGGNTWKYVKTFRHTEYANMLGHDKIRHESYVTYYGTAGYSYKANVSVWAGNEDGDGDVRYLWTAPDKAI